MKKTSTCQEVKEHIIEIVEQKLNKLPDNDELLSHISSCPQCSRLVNRFSELWKQLESPQEVEPSSDFLPRLLKKVEEYEDRKTLFQTVFVGLKLLFRAAPFAGLITIGIFTGKFLGDTQPKLDVPAYSQDIPEYYSDFVEIPSDSLADAYLRLSIDGKEKNS